MFSWIHSWWERRSFRKTFRLLRPLLRKRYGGADFYTAGQVVTTGKVAGLGLEQQFWAIAILVGPGEADAVLREMGSTETQEQIRRRLLDLFPRDYREDNFEANTEALFDLMSGGSESAGEYGGHGDASGGDSGGGHH